jgi:hypothetical protein
MNERVQKCLDLTRELRELRMRKGDVDGPENDALLDSMDVAWAALTPDDVQTVEAEIETLWPREPS